MKAGTASYGQAPVEKGTTKVSTARKSTVTKLNQIANKNTSETENIRNSINEEALRNMREMRKSIAF